MSFLYRSIIGRRFFFIVGTLYLYRCITMYITTLPVPGMHFKCSPKVQYTDALISRHHRHARSFSYSPAFGIIVLLNGQLQEKKNPHLFCKLKAYECSTLTTDCEMCVHFFFVCVCVLASLFLSFLLDNAAIVLSGEQLHIHLLKASAQHFLLG